MSTEEKEALELGVERVSERISLARWYLEEGAYENVREMLREIWMSAKIEGSTDL